jgi:hypothetical protein
MLIFPKYIFREWKDLERQDEMGRDGTAGFAAQHNMCNGVTVPCERRKGTESCLFQEVSTADLGARLGAQLGLKEPNPACGIFEVEVRSKWIAKTKSTICDWKFSCLLFGMLEKQAHLYRALGLFWGNQGTVGSGGKEIDVSYDDILIPEPTTYPPCLLYIRSAHLYLDRSSGNIFPSYHLML